MHVVIFEVEPRPGNRSTYFELAADLRSSLEGFDGFISIERFESLSLPGKILSLSCWRDEEAIRAWRNVERHRNAQRTGRRSLFTDYRIRVAHVVRDYGLNRPAGAPRGHTLVDLSLLK